MANISVKGKVLPYEDSALPVSINFVSDGIIGTSLSPVSGASIAFDFNLAKKGSKVVVFINQANEPTYPASARFVGGQFVSNVLNMLVFEYNNDNLVQLAKLQPSTTDNPQMIGIFNTFYKLRVDDLGQTITVATGAEGRGSNLVAPYYLTYTVTAVNDAKGRYITAAGAACITPSAYTFAYRADFVLPVLQTAGEDAIYAAGFTAVATVSAQPGTQANEAQFLCANAINSGRITFRIRVASATVHDLDTGVLPIVNTRYICQVEYKFGILKVYVNGVLTNTVNAPTMPTTVLACRALLFKSVGTGAFVAHSVLETLGIY